VFAKEEKATGSRYSKFFKTRANNNIILRKDTMTETKAPDKNSIHFAWINSYAGILLKTPRKTLLIDPVDIKPKHFPQVDAVLITHEHYDHLDQRLVVEIQKATDCRVIADSASAKSLNLQIPTDKLAEAHVGDYTRIGEVTIKAEKCKHQAQSPVTYIVTSEDGVRVWHTADSLPYPEMAQISQKEPADIIFCTVGIAQGATPKTGSEIAWLAKPKVAVPYHTNTAESQREFARILKAELPKTTCLVPEQNKIYQISIGEKNHE
jgi:L-ascorbate metabolism protein UlaG (beta-lactamase superfamily)